MALHEYTKQRLTYYLDNVLGKSLGEADVKHVFNKAISNPKITGIAGDVIEVSVLGYDSDSDQEPDLVIDGVKTELKTTGIRLKENRYEAKEPMSITAVSINTIIYESFEKSHFWQKTEHMLWVYYQYNADKVVPALQYQDFLIRGYQFVDFSGFDRIVMEHDWTLVRDFIIDANKTENPEALYPLISTELNAQTVYLDTAPKYPNPPRFRIRKRVITAIIQAHFGKTLEQLPGRYTGYEDVYRKCREIRALYGGKSVAELCALFGIQETEKKGISEQLVCHMFGGKSKKANQIELFSKFGFIVKSVVVTTKGSRTEDTKLYRPELESWKNQTFEESDLYEYFTEHQFIFPIFMEQTVQGQLSENVFIGFKLLSLSKPEIIEGDARHMFEKAKALISENKLMITTERNRNGEVIKNKNGSVRETVNLPKSSDYTVFFRGSAQDSSEKSKTQVINGLRMIPQYVWLKGAWLTEELKRTELL